MLRKRNIVVGDGFYFGHNTETVGHFSSLASMDLGNFIFNSNLSVVKALFVWLYNNKPLSQQIDIHQWYDSKWYIVLRTNKENYGDANGQIGFTVDIKKDIILWSNDKENTVSGGNCFTRNHKWRKLLKDRYKVEEHKEFYWYPESTFQKIAARNRKK